MHNANERWYNFNSKYRGKDIKLRSTKTSAKIDFDRLFHDKLTDYTNGVVCQLLYRTY